MGSRSRAIVVVVATLVLAGLASCAPRDPAGPIAQSWLDALNTHDPDRVFGLMTPDASYTDPMAQAPLSGDGLRTFLTQGWQAWSDRVYAARRAISDGDGVVVEWHMQQTHDGRPLPIDGVFALRLRDGRIQSVRSYYDVTPYLRLLAPSGHQRPGTEPRQ